MCKQGASIGNALEFLQVLATAPDDADVAETEEQGQEESQAKKEVGMPTLPVVIVWPAGLFSLTYYASKELLFGILGLTKQIPTTKP
jgi:hypothetical protein